MRFKITKQDLLEGIFKVQNAVSNNSSISILGNILLETKKDSLKITATDLDICICTTIPVKVEVDGAITVPTKKFIEIVKTLDEGEIDISLKKNVVVLKSGKINLKVLGMEKEEYPELPEFVKKESFTIKQSTLKEMLNLVDFSMSQDSSKRVLSGILFEICADQLQMVATDGRRLATINTKIKNDTKIGTDIIVPAKAIREVKRLLNANGDVEIKYNDKQILFNFESSLVLSRLIEDNYPDYKKVIPTTNTSIVTVSKDDLLNSLKRAKVFCSQDYVAVELNIQENKISLFKNSKSLGEIDEDIVADFGKNEPIKIGFNPQYLIDVLEKLEEDELKIELTDGMKPAVIRLGKEYMYIVLPMTINN